MPKSASAAPMQVSTAYFQAASTASEVFGKLTRNTDRRVVSSTAIQTSVTWDKSGTASIERRNKL